MKEAEWEELLLAATERVRAKVMPLARREGRGRVVGVGAAGDQTIFADKLAEDELLRSLKGAGPLRVLSEEAGILGDEGASAIAILDPLDGSSNFERGLPFYCTSVAIATGDRADDVTVGVVRDLVHGDVYAARKGRGATKNGRPIATSRGTDPSKSVVGVDLSRGPPGLAASMGDLIEGVKRQVHLGANALELCYLAEGKIDSFVDLRGRMRVTDFAAAALIAREAGGLVSGPGGERLSPAFDLRQRFSFVASANRAMHRKILELCGTRT